MARIKQYRTRTSVAAIRERVEKKKKNGVFTYDHPRIHRCAMRRSDIAHLDMMTPKLDSYIGIINAVCTWKSMEFLDALMEEMGMI